MIAAQHARHFRDADIGFADEIAVDRRPRAAASLMIAGQDQRPAAPCDTTLYSMIGHLFARAGMRRQACHAASSSASVAE